MKCKDRTTWQKIWINELSNTRIAKNPKRLGQLMKRMYRSTGNIK